MNRQEQDDLRERLRRAALVGAGVTGAMGATEGALRYLKDRDFMAANRPTRRFDDFVDKMEPGDLVFHRTPTRYAALTKPWSFGPDFINEALAMIAGKGDTFYHPSVHLDDGRVMESSGFEKGISRTDLANPETPEELLVMRARKRALAAKALDYAKKAEGGSYKTYDQTLKHAGRHLAGLKEASGKGACSPGSVCSEFVADAYPSLFKDRLASPFDMRHHPDLEFVARYAPTSKVTLGENIAAHGVYPLLRNMKFGLLAGGTALGAGALMRYANNSEETKR